MLSSSDFLGHHFIHHATKQGNTKAIADASTRYTYAQLLDEITHMAGHLKGLGLKKGDRAIVALGNTTQHVIAHFGILFAGGISVPLPHDLGTNRLAFYIKDTQAALIISRDGIFDNTQTKRSPFQDYRQANSTISPAKKEDLACIMYTTGSTNHPKGVMLTHQTLLAALSHIMHYVPYQEINRELILLPISHSFGLGHLYCATIAGGFAFIEEGLQKMKRVFNTLETEKISCMPATPPICSMFLGRYRDFFLKKARFLQRMVVNSAPLPPEITKKMLDALPHLRLLVYYGLKIGRAHV